VKTTSLTSVKDSANVQYMSGGNPQPIS